MSVKFKLIRSIEFIHSSSDGEIDFEKSKHLLAEMAKAKNSPADFDVILDFRGTQLNLNTFQIYDLSRELAKHDETFKDKIAVLVLPGLEFNKAEFLEYCFKQRGLNVDVFTNYENAVSWFYKEKN